jgi:hypothetical protein
MYVYEKQCERNILNFYLFTFFVEGNNHCIGEALEHSHFLVNDAFLSTDSGTTIDS